MKPEDLARPGLFTLGLFGVAATALLGFAAGVAVSRDPESLMRTARRLARDAAKGIERASFFAAQASEHIGDLWAEAREEARAEIDAAEFERASGRTSAPSAPAGNPAPAAKKRSPRARATPARKRAGAVAADGAGKSAKV